MVATTKGYTVWVEQVGSHSKYLARISQSNAYECRSIKELVSCMVDLQISGVLRVTHLSEHHEYHTLDRTHNTATHVRPFSTVERKLLARYLTQHTHTE